MPARTRTVAAASRSVATRARAGRPSARMRIASGCSRVVRISGRPSPAAEPRVAIGSEGRHARDGGVLDARYGLHDKAGRQAVVEFIGGAITEIADHADGLPGHHHEPVVEAVRIDRDPVEPLADLERHGLADDVEVLPAAGLPRLQPRVPEDEGAVVDILEVRLAVDATGDPDVFGGARARDLDGLANGDRGRRGKEATDPEAGSIASEHRDTAAKGGDAGEDHDEAVHGRE